MWEGSTSFDSTIENSSTGITMSGICANSAPRTPSIISSGLNAATVVSTPKVTGTATSRVPSIAACTRSGLRRMWV